ncbi:LysM peptidoglycan-binding domain-containing protein [Gammaproteobacteria bacterium AH-315-E17]|nr:LysM peptidoglycan-binding domain-containing protein [Gammaproteobacteria bacterium AH-315-E17]
MAVLCLSALFPLSAILAQQGSGLTIRDDSPQSYLVVDGDTLWDIAGVFLEEPWLWPEIWQVNPQIQNPDLIYPGDTLELYFVDGQPRITVQRGGNAPGISTSRVNDTDLPVVVLSPRVRREQLLSPIPAISLESISSLLSNNRIVGVADLDDAPTLLGSRSDTRFSSEGDIVFAKGSWTPGISSYEILRPNGGIEDPQSGEVIAIQAKLIGRATILDEENGEATLIIDSNLEEVREGDYFVVSEAMTLSSQYFPVPPMFAVDARILDIEFGRSIGGKKDTVIVNLGRQDQIEPGHLLSLQKDDNLVRDPTATNRLLSFDSGSEMLTFNGEIYGRILIYKVFDNHSFALVLSSDLPVSLNDRVITP